MFEKSRLISDYSSEMDEELLRKPQRNYYGGDYEEEEDDYISKRVDEYSSFKTLGSDVLRIESMSMLLSKHMIPTSLGFINESS